MSNSEGLEGLVKLSIPAFLGLNPTLFHYKNCISNLNLCFLLLVNAFLLPLQDVINVSKLGLRLS